MALTVATINCKGLRDKGKRNLVFDRCKLGGYDIVFVQEAHIISKEEEKLWEKEWRGKTFWSFGWERSNGTGILLHPKLDVSIKYVWHDYEGRVVVVDCDIDTFKIRLMAVYCPNDGKERKEFIENFQQQCATTRKIIQGGDYNFVENISLDKVGGNSLSGSIGVSEIRKLKQDFNLVEPFRKMYPNKKEYSFHMTGIHSRLDRFYISNDLFTLVKDVTINPSTFSDHDIVVLEFKPFNQASFEYGPGFWKCNVSVLQEPKLVHEITEVWQHVLSKIAVKDGYWWEMCKATFRQKIIDFCKNVSTELKKKISKLEKDLAFLRVCERNELVTGTFTDQIESVKLQINDIINSRLEGSKIRSRIQYIEETEKPTRYFLRKEVQKMKGRKINKLTDTNGNDVTTNEGIMKICKDFYENLFGSEGVDQSLVEHFLEGVPTLPTDLKEQCEGLLTYEECVESIKSMKDGKTPGSDGLPKEFYVQFFHLFGQDYVNMINLCYDLGQLTESQRLGLIRLICKNIELANLLGYWRPISLLNVDYKIVSKSMCIRLKKVLPYIIDIDQTCAIINRSIIDSLHTLRNVVEYCEQKKVKCALICIDQMKAFDRVEHSYLFQVLKAFGFGPSFIGWIQLLYKNIKSAVMTNGFISDKFNVTRSVRQGCALSPLLYVLAIEPFAIKIRSDPHIRGLRMPGVNREIRIVQYADDNTNIVTTDESIRKVFMIAELYGKASGGLINKTKTLGFWLGGWKDRKDQPCEIKWVSVVKCLGLRFAHDDMYNINWKPVFDKYCKALNDSVNRNISYKGRAVLANTVAASKIWYVGSVLSLPEIWSKKMIKEMFVCVWKGKPEGVKRKAMYTPYTEGGVGIINITCKLHALKIMHIKDLVYGEYRHWHNFAIYWIGFALRELRPDFASNLIPHCFDVRPRFYEECLESFRLIMRIKSDFDLEKATTKSVYMELLKPIVEPPCVAIKYPLVQFKTVFNNVVNRFISPELRDLNWKIVHQILPVNMLLYHRSISRTSTCVFCTQVESLDHLFISCRMAKGFWPLVQDIVRNMFNVHIHITADSIFHHKSPGLSIPENEMFYLLLSMGKYVIWNVRNRRKFDRVNVGVEECKRMFKAKLKSRCVTDGCRMSLEDFTKRWSKGRVLAIKDRTGGIDFLL